MNRTLIDYGKWADEYISDAEKMTELIRRHKCRVKDGTIPDDYDNELKLRTYREIRLELVKTAAALRKRAAVK